MKPGLTRRQYGSGIFAMNLAPVVSSLILLACGIVGALSSPLRGAAVTASSGVIDIGARRELLVDGLLVDRLMGKAELRLHHPTAREIVLVHDAPWEGNATCYNSVFRDGDLYRMYYRAWNLAVAAKGVEEHGHPQVVLLCGKQRQHSVAPARWGCMSFTARRPITSSLSRTRSATLRSRAGE